MNGKARSILFALVLYSALWAITAIWGISDSKQYVLEHVEFPVETTFDSIGPVLRLGERKEQNEYATLINSISGIAYAPFILGVTAKVDAGIPDWRFMTFWVFGYTEGIIRR